jgi:hypothetical protein
MNCQSTFPLWSDSLGPNLGLYEFYVDIYKAMRHWLSLNLALAQSYPHNLLKDPNTPQAAYLHGLLKSNEVELRYSDGVLGFLVFFLFFSINFFSLGVF